MDAKDVVFDISSDEEVGWVETGGVSVDDDFDWISELLGEVDSVTDDSDDVLFVGEVVLNPKQSLKSSSAVVKKSSVKDVDDDCVVLDGDPDEPVAIENNTVGESDDLFVVSEKGQVACRDYPHPRHLCAKFPFTSTPHQRHCDQCHCYVCESLAPCVHWGSGISNVDHCHATDKGKFWKLQRKCLKNSAPNNSLSTRQPQMNQVPPATPLEPNYMPQVQVFRPTSTRACSMSTNSGIPNVINQSRSQQSGYAVPQNKFQPNLISRPLLSKCNSHRRHNVGNLGPQFISPRSVFKRTGSPGVALTTNQCGHRSSNKNYRSQYSRNPAPVATPIDKNPTTWPDFHDRMTPCPGSNTYQISSQPKVGSIFANSVPSEPQVSSQQNVGGVFINSVPSHPQVSSQPNASSVFVNSVPFQPQVSSQPNGGSVFVNSVPSQLQVPSQTCMGSIFENSMPSQTQVSSQPNDGSTFANSVPSQSQVYSEPNPISDDCQNILQQGNQSQSAVCPSFPDFDLSWNAPTCQSNQQPPAENSQLQGVVPTVEPSLVAEFDNQFTGSTQPGSLDFQFDDWILDSHLVSGAMEVSMMPGFYAVSPEPAPIDSGIFVDF